MELLKPKVIIVLISSPPSVPPVFAPAHILHTVTCCRQVHRLFHLFSRQSLSLRANRSSVHVHLFLCIICSAPPPPHHGVCWAGRVDGHTLHAAAASGATGTGISSSGVWFIDPTMSCQVSPAPSSLPIGWSGAEARGLVSTLRSQAPPERFRTFAERLRPLVAASPSRRL